jgi:hypothetical protein
VWVWAWAWAWARRAAGGPGKAPAAGKAPVGEEGRAGGGAGPR